MRFYCMSFGNLHISARNVSNSGTEGSQGMQVLHFDRYENYSLIKKNHGRHVFVFN